MSIGIGVDRIDWTMSHAMKEVLPKDDRLDVSRAGVVLAAHMAVI